MEDLDMNMVGLIVGVLLFFGMLFGFSTYSDSMKYECRTKAIEKNMSASDIQAICK